MRIAYLDCFSGISGDMFLGALVDAGVPLRLLQKTIESLDLGASLEVSRVSRSGISATKVDVVVDGNKDLPREEYWAKGNVTGFGEQVLSKNADSTSDHRHPHEHGAHDHHHAPEHEHELSHDSHHVPGGHHLHEHPHNYEHTHDHEHSHEHGRGLTEIKAIIGRARISERAKEIATAAFDALGAAEAKIHNSSLEKIHFHEVGAVDALVDVICGAVGADFLGVGRWLCSPLNVGGGAVECAHGRFPIPAPATLELLKGAPVYSSGAQVELVTPTGAALLRALTPEYRAFPTMQVAAVGYGAGSRDIENAPNVLRISVGEPHENAAGKEESQHSYAEDVVMVIEASVDDLNPQVFGYVMERALAGGALDIFAAPLHMKKNRPGMLLTLLARPQEAESLARLIFAETTTLGVRLRQERRLVLQRQWVPARTPWGEVRIKVGSSDGTLANCAPEYEDCRRLALQHRVPLKSVMQQAMKAYLEHLPESPVALGPSPPTRRNAMDTKATRKKQHPKYGAKR
jgi:uncharacterized protein (TIGR00299 family) protein